MGIEVTKIWLLLLSCGYLLMSVKVASSIFVNQLNPIQGGSWAALHILVISPQRKLGSLWNLKLMFIRYYLTTNQFFIKICPKISAHEAKTRVLAMHYKDSDPSQQKSRKCVFRPFLNRHQKKLFYSLLLIRQKNYESSKTEYSTDWHPSFFF